MLNRRQFLAALASTSMLGMGRVSASTPVASPAATPQGGKITIVGEGTLRDPKGTPTFEIHLTWSDGGFEGGFTLTAFPMEGTEWVIESTEIVDIKPLSERSSHIKRITGYASIDGTGEQVFLLDLDPGLDDAPQELNFVLGPEAAPFLGEDVKLGCDCGPMGLALRSPFVSGGFEITEN